MTPVESLGVGSGIKSSLLLALAVPTLKYKYKMFTNSFMLMYTIKNTTCMYKTKLGSSFAIADDILSFFYVANFSYLDKECPEKGECLEDM